MNVNLAYYIVKNNTGVKTVNLINVKIQFVYMINIYKNKQNVYYVEDMANAYMY